MAWLTIGYETQKEDISKAWAQKRLAHAYLLAGSSGIGRRRLALDIAKLSNCLAPVNHAPCNECNPCKRIEINQHPDVVIIDPSQPTENSTKSSRPTIQIAHIQQMCHTATLTPYEGKYRVFIVDVVEEITLEAANALLKTLEEPTESTLILLVVNSVSAVLPTIASRCQVMQMSPLPDETLEEVLKQRSSDEQLIKTVLKHAEGRLGWAISTLSDPAELERIQQAQLRCQAMLEGDMMERFATADELAKRWRSQRAEVLGELDQWVKWWRTIAMSKLAKTPPTDQDEAITSTAKKLTEDQIYRAWRSVDEAKDALRNSITPRLALDILALQLPQPTTGEAG